MGFHKAGTLGMGETRLETFIWVSRIVVFLKRLPMASPWPRQFLMDNYSFLKLVLVCLSEDLLLNLEYEALVVFAGKVFSRIISVCWTQSSRTYPSWVRLACLAHGIPAVSLSGLVMLACSVTLAMSHFLAHGVSYTWAHLGSVTFFFVAYTHSQLEKKIHFHIWNQMTSLWRT